MVNERALCVRRAARGAGLALLCLASAGALNASAQEQPATQAAPAAEKLPPAWTVSCSSTGADAALVCNLSQIIVVKDSGQRVLTVTVGTEGGKMMLKLGLPHGLALQKGVDVWIDQGARQNHPIVTADQKGSYALIPLEEGMIGALKQGTDLNVSVTAYAGNALVIGVSLKGFTAAFAKL